MKKNKNSECQTNMMLNFFIEENGITVYPTQKSENKLPYSEKDLLKGLNVKTVHADELANFL